LVVTFVFRANGVVQYYSGYNTRERNTDPRVLLPRRSGSRIGIRSSKVLTLRSSGDTVNVFSSKRSWKRLEDVWVVGEVAQVTRSTCRGAPTARACVQEESW